MPNILRIKARWQGFVGSPGFSIFHFRDFSSEGFTADEAAGAAARVRGFFSAQMAYLPDGVNIQVEAEGEVIDVASGQLVDTVSAGVHEVVNGGAGFGTTFSAPSGAVVTWRTATIRNGRRMRGRTFVVPLANGAYQADGTLNNGIIAALNDGATSLRDNSLGLDFCVYGRPPAGGVGAGTYGPVSGHSVPDRVAILSSRRD
jgi:hypothetical protein